MNFFGHQDDVHRNTVRLVLLFALAIAILIGILYLVVISTLASTDIGINHMWQPEIFLMVVVSILGTVGMGSLTKTLQLRGGGKVVALSMEGRGWSGQSVSIGGE